MKTHTQRARENRKTLLPPGVAYIINGHWVTPAEILEAKRERQRRELARKRAPEGNTVTPCFVWTFYNDSWVYGGWWLYVKTASRDWRIDGRIYDAFIPTIMALYPCGILPMRSEFDHWKAEFARQYARATRKRPYRQGMALARAVVDRGGMLQDVLPWKQ